ncbi:hypothetical protein GUITHDRAFT_119053 [Guillardia theta CCMP2712]|uniref:BCD1 alpha/beta domain-containing protein n=1 Tax=Guillardia theta (strain CCMP2712) TaxID=905079 RepID=L1IET4_GUITC|nr:hypothetical protein GUITHDRAFT_119053 [Guillardia theta CCMP2712]EKX34743.1 hypothetical protein GUITHDRAFT_119053 [Guillardia theta CCMP2712]|eukprot:XP_005821723.1 hypothetical protein GUITHDRAFT_119053 [Guillardia theta CCMP2712]
MDQGWVKKLEESRMSEGEKEASEGDQSSEEETLEGHKTAISCEMCCKAEAKYTCPGGRRDVAEYKNLTEFTDSDMRNDFQFLMDAERIADNAHREGYKEKLYVKSKVPQHLQQISRYARWRGVNMIVMPSSFKRRKDNTSSYCHQRKLMLWKLELVFDLDEPLTITEDRVPDSTSLRDILSKYFDVSCTHEASVRCKLQAFQSMDLDNLSLFIKVEPSKANDVKYYELSIDSTIAEALKHKIVIEHPTILVMLKSKAADMPTIPHPVSMQEVFEDTIAASTGGAASLVETIPYVKKRAHPYSESARHFDKRGRGGNQSWRGRGRGRRDVRAGRGDSQQEVKKETETVEPGHRNEEEIELDEDLEDPELLSKIAEAVDPEELKKVEQEINQALGLSSVDS